MVSELFRVFQRFLEVFRGFQRFLEVFRGFSKASQRPSQSAIFLSELRVVLPLIVLPLKTPAKITLTRRYPKLIFRINCRRNYPEMPLPNAWALTRNWLRELIKDYPYPGLPGINFLN